MVQFSRSPLPALAAASLLGFVFASLPAKAEDATTNLGPVGPREPLLVKMGDKRLIAYFEPNGGNCFVSAVVFDSAPDGGGYHSTKVRVALHPGELFHLDGVEDRRVVLLCGFNADNLMVLNRAEVVTQAANIGE